MSQDTLTDRYNPVKEIVETNRLVCSVPYVHLAPKAVWV